MRENTVLILKDLGELSVVTCDYGFKDGKELGSVSKGRVKAPPHPASDA